MPPIFFNPSRTPPHHLRPQTNCRGLLSKPNQEPPFCDMQNIDQLPISEFYYNIYYSHTELQSPRGRRFCLLCCLLFTELSRRVTPNADVLSARGGVWALKTPFSRLSCSSQGSHFKQKSQFTRPPFEKIWKF